MTDIIVIPLDESRFRVTVSGEGSESVHEVRVTEEERGRYGRPGQSAEDLVRDAFHFLLEREPKESILPSFTLADIERYFPEFGP